ncbi:hypothetical protein DDZ18_08885 [Marinicauda salina]|uniref:Uncharacterized protein n=1 Tax=Marinicauda salina TaxID=2135793 RepID=A0A2U2BUU9_9PROT|nr:hypothetical protein [Marinicauda salina]PWE17759.1 hypothetical protein DDZ18_08885 [Marinicauda salina]
MSTENTRLNIERARQALSKARLDGSNAVRSPRPADLSRLRELEIRREHLDSRAATFRTEVRSRLGLGDYARPDGSAAPIASVAMDGALCDAEMCAPGAPQLQPRHVPAPDAATRNAAEAAKSKRGRKKKPAKRDAEAKPKKKRKLFGLF